MQVNGLGLQEIALLTRPGCANTPAMAANLNDALHALGAASRYDVVDVERLPRGDVRRGYPTPTVLFRGLDLFGMSEPVPPFPEPT